MDCREFRETYTDFLDGLLPEADEVRARGHVAVCVSCRRFHAAYRQGVAALRSLPACRVSRNFGTHVLHRVRREPRVPLLSGAYGLAGATLVLALLGFLALDLSEGGRDAQLAQADVMDTVPAMPAADSGFDVITVRPRDASHEILAIDPYLTGPTRDANSASRIRFEVPAVWSER